MKKLYIKSENATTMNSANNNVIKGTSRGVEGENRNNADWRIYVRTTPQSNYIFKDKKDKKVLVVGYVESSDKTEWVVDNTGRTVFKKDDPNTEIKNDYIDISWEQILDLTYFYQYEIYRAPDNGLTDVTLMASIPNSSIEHFQDRNAGSGTTWYYSVAIVDINGRRSFSSYIPGWILP